jgi:hypothetical protein
VGQGKPADDGAARPGKQFDESYKSYDQWWSSPEADYAKDMAAVLPEFASQIQSIAWTYRSSPEGAADALQRAGIWDAWFLKSGSGSGSRGGGGGGGATRAQQYAQAEATIRNEVKSMGVAFSDESIKQLAKSVVDGNWSPDMVTDYIVAGAGDWDTLQAGQITATADAVRKMAASQLITVSEDTAREYARRVSSGELTQDGINAIMLGQAKAQFAWLTPQLDSGMTVRDILLPSRDVIARELEMNADTIDLANTKWQNMLTVKEPNGTTRAATNNELVVNARRSPEWQNTKGARDLTAAAIMRIRSMFFGD